jgi:ATP-dependent exoDNAse (exonuclease V) alpha subunit
MVPQTSSVNENRIFDLAEMFIQQTTRSMFLTGKAGTGKTTFLKRIMESAGKNTVVVAPTGVAAVNAGGVTIHSFFQLPFSPFVPDLRSLHKGERLTDRYTLLQNLRIESEKRNLFRELELLIIDEVSMVRCDVLDSIDVILRHFRRKPYLPFGGVQLLLIGDLFQLPPVVPDEEWELLKQFYRSPFFFDAYAIRESPPVYIELKKIFRQRDPVFINILNRVRRNEVTDADLKILNERFVDSYVPSDQDRSVILTTHNSKADKINNDQLNRLPGEIQYFEGTVEGDFPERSFPTEKVLTLKPGAQIMFLKNDMERVRRYYNGKIGTISRIEFGNIYVEFAGEDGELQVEKDSWRNVRYTYNPSTRQIEEEVLGTFTQYAIRLAWAITIHKSQGLTFERAIIDAGASFAPGQVYVALSRCTSIEGMILKSKLSRTAIMTDRRIIEFANEELPEDKIAPLMEVERKHSVVQALVDVFDWSVLKEELADFRAVVSKSKLISKEDAYALVERFESVATQQEEVVIRFGQQLTTLRGRNDFQSLVTRVDQAVAYFIKLIDTEFLVPLEEYSAEVKKIKRVKKYSRHVDELVDFLKNFQDVLRKASGIASGLKEE